MDIDLELDTDQIGEFLQSKLAEIKVSNDKLEKSLNHRNETAMKLSETRINNTEASLSWASSWKRMNNNHYILGLGLQNKTTFCLENIRVILNWNLSSTLNYKSYLISGENENLLYESLKWKIKERQAAQLILVFDVPLFTEQLACAISVSITFQRNNQKEILNFPSTIQLIPEDITNNLIVVQMDKIIDGNREDFLSYIFSMNKYEFMMVFDGNWNRLLESTLLVDCSLTGINNKSKTKKYFLTYRVCSTLDGTLLEVADDTELQHSVFLNIYFRDGDKLVAFFHYLHKHIPDVAIVPKQLYKPKFHLGEPLELIKKNLSKEIEHLRKRSANPTDFRLQLANLEHETDVALASAT